MTNKYLQELQQKKLSSGKTTTEKKADKKFKGDWYSCKIEQARKCRCENCNAPLAPSMVINAATVVCHIIPKAKVASVAFHPNNYWFGCSVCHDKFDAASSEEIEAMPAFEKIYYRVLSFINDIPASEMQWVKDCFRN